jgi:hypothetical protein
VGVAARSEKTMRIPLEGVRSATLAAGNRLHVRGSTAAIRVGARGKKRLSKAVAGRCPVAIECSWLSDGSEKKSEKRERECDVTLQVAKIEMVDLWTGPYCVRKKKYR